MVQELVEHMQKRSAGKAATQFAAVEMMKGASRMMSEAYSLLYAAELMREYEDRAVRMHEAKVCFTAAAKMAGMAQEHFAHSGLDEAREHAIGLQCFLEANAEAVKY